MFSTKNLIEALEHLASDLEFSGKAETAKFFREVIAELSEVKDANSCKESLEKIIHSAVMSQYAGFSYKQDVLFAEVFDEAKRLAG